MKKLGYFILLILNSILVLAAEEKDDNRKSLFILVAILIGLFIIAWIIFSSKHTSSRAYKHTYKKLKKEDSSKIPVPIVAKVEKEVGKIEEDTIAVEEEETKEEEAIEKVILDVNLEGKTYKELVEILKQLRSEIYAKVQLSTNKKAKQYWKTNRQKNIGDAVKKVLSLFEQEETNYAHQEAHMRKQSNVLDDLLTFFHELGKHINNYEGEISAIENYYTKIEERKDNFKRKSYGKHFEQTSTQLFSVYKDEKKKKQILSNLSTYFQSHIIPTYLHAQEATNGLVQLKNQADTLDDTWKELETKLHRELKQLLKEYKSGEDIKAHGDEVKNHIFTAEDSISDLVDNREKLRKVLGQQDENASKLIQIMERLHTDFDKLKLLTREAEKAA
jgi:hypothetical protein